MQYKLDLWSKYDFDLKQFLLPQQLPLDCHLKYIIFVSIKFPAIDSHLAIFVDQIKTN